MEIIFQQILNGVIIGSVYCLIALGLTMIFGILEVTNFAHGEIYMIGAYTSLFITSQLEIHFLLSLLIAMAVVGVLGVLIERVVFRPILGKPMINGMLLSFGLSVFLTNLALLLFKADPRKIESGYSQVRLTFAGLQLTLERLMVIIVSTLLVIALYFFIQKTKLGKAMRAVTQDREAAQLAGVSISNIFALTFAMGCSLAAAAGSLGGALFTVYPSMGWTPVLKSFVVVIMGGFGNVAGAIIAAMLLGLTESLCGGFISYAYKDAYAFLLLVVVLLIKPEGIVGGRG